MTEKLHKSIPAMGDGGGVAVGLDTTAAARTDNKFVAIETVSYSVDVKERSKVDATKMAKLLQAAIGTKTDDKDKGIKVSVNSRNEVTIDIRSVRAKEILKHLDEKKSELDAIGKLAQGQKLNDKDSAIINKLEGRESQPSQQKETRQPAQTHSTQKRETPQQAQNTPKKPEKKDVVSLIDEAKVARSKEGQAPLALIMAKNTIEDIREKGAPTDKDLKNLEKHLEGAKKDIDKLTPETMGKVKAAIIASNDFIRKERVNVKPEPAKAPHEDTKEVWKQNPSKFCALDADYKNYQQNIKGGDGSIKEIELGHTIDKLATAHHALTTGKA